MDQNEWSQDFLKPRDIGRQLQIILRLLTILKTRITRSRVCWLQPIDISLMQQKAAEDIVHDLSKYLNRNVSKFTNNRRCLPMVTNLLHLPSDFVELHDKVFGGQVNLQVLFKGLAISLRSTAFKTLRRRVVIILASRSLNREVSRLIRYHFFEF